MADKRRPKASKRITLRLPGPVLEQIKAASEADQRRVSDWCRVALLRALAQASEQKTVLSA